MRIGKTTAISRQNRGKYFCLSISYNIGTVKDTSLGAKLHFIHYTTQAHDGQYKMRHRKS